MPKRTVLIILIIIVTLGLCLRYYGHTWGVPRKPYWRNHFQDEAFILGQILAMEPHDLNPHYFINPSFHFYTLLSSFKAASLYGLIEPFTLPVDRNKLGQPVNQLSLDSYQRMYIIGRVISICCSTLVIILVFSIGCLLYDKITGLVAAAFTAILPTLAFQAHFLVVDTPAVFWLTFAFFIISARHFFKCYTSWLVLSSIGVGLAVGTKYTNIIVILPLLYCLYRSHRAMGKSIIRSLLNRDLLILTGVCAIVFFITTPHAIVSFKEFMYGNSDGFGGIFGKRGLFAYNDYPASFTAPFTVATYHSLRLPLLILALLAVIWLIIMRKPADIMILFFVIPFYILLIHRASPHLRHVMVLLPFLMISTARLISGLLLIIKAKIIKYSLMIICSGVYIYTLLFTLAYIGRFTKTDTRIASADWLSVRIVGKTSIGLASYFPWNYSPPVDMLTSNIVITGYSYDVLLAQKPDYFVITEYEFRYFYRARAPEQKCRLFIELLFSEKNYEIVRILKKDFSILGLNFTPHFPNMDWNPVNPAIYIFKLKS
jgi:hypothetical protein